MSKTEYILMIIEWVIFALSSICVLYLLIFSFASLFKSATRKSQSSLKRKILVIFPAYKEDNVIIDSIKSFLHQDYQTDLFELTVVSDHMKPETNEILRSLPITLLLPAFDESSKAKALRFAINHSKSKDYDIVVILDADNTVNKDFLSRINDSFDYYSAVQAHRTSKNRNTRTAVLDGVSEEINNSIFRKGHNNLGLSSALIGSGMAFSYNWFKDNVENLSTSGEDKELEILLLKQRVHIEYLEDVYVFDEKTQKSSGFYNQRRRWLATQLYSVWRSIKDFLPALFKWNIDYLDKLFQWLIPPRILLVGGIGLMAIIISIISLPLSLKWWISLVVLIATLCIAIPGKLWDKPLLKAISEVPLLFIMMAANLFRIKGADKKFIHTEKGYENSNRSTTDIQEE